MKLIITASAKRPADTHKGKKILKYINKPLDRAINKSKGISPKQAEKIKKVTRDIEKITEKQDKARAKFAEADAKLTVKIKALNDKLSRLTVKVSKV